MWKICCELFIFQRNNVSSQAYTTLCQCTPFEASEMADNHVYLMTLLAPTPRELRNSRRNSVAGLPKKDSLLERNDIVRAKFRRDYINHSGDIANSRFQIWRPSVILNVKYTQISAFHMACSHNLYFLANLRRDRLNSCGDIANFRFPIRRPSSILCLKVCQRVSTCVDARAHAA